jgi:hypothetical protein
MRRALGLLLIGDGLRKRVSIAIPELVVELVSRMMRFRAAGRWPSWPGSDTDGEHQPRPVRLEKHEPGVFAAVIGDEANPRRWSRRLRNPVDDLPDTRTRID